MENRKKTSIRILYVIGIMALFSPLLIIALLVLYFTGITFLTPFVIIIYFLAIIGLISKLFLNQKQKKIVLYITIGCLIMSLVYAIPGIYHKTRPVVQPSNVDLFEYSPFGENTKAVTLNEQSTFQIDHQLPVLDGATAFYPIYASFAQAVYPEKEYHPYNSEVMSNRTGIAYDYLIEGFADIIFALAPSDEQLAFAEEQGVELKLTPIGKEAFVFFVNNKNPVENLTVDEVKGIYSGEITNWKDVGGKNKSIRAFQRDKNSGSQTALERFMGDTPIMDPPVEDIATLMGTMLDVVSDYKNYQNAIGYTFRHYSTEMVENNDIRLLNIDGVEPTVESIKSGQYPIIDEFYAITAGSNNPHLDDFIEWILSDQGQEIIEKSGYAPIN